MHQQPGMRLVAARMTGYHIGQRAENGLPIVTRSVSEGVRGGGEPRLRFGLLYLDGRLIVG